MATVPRWDPCVSHRGESEFAGFVDDYLSQDDRNILLVLGVGFDARSCVLVDRLSGVSVRMHALMVKEVRPRYSLDQSNRAKRNSAALCAACPSRDEARIEIFGSDGAAIGGRKVASFLATRSFEGITDIIVDISALSIGISFPIIRYLLQCLDDRQRPQNLHIFLAHSPEADAEVHPVPCDTPSYVHGFRSGSTLSDNEDIVKLWMPKLAFGRRTALEKIHDFLVPHETCPILPFPASDPRRGDMLATEYVREIEDAWSVDARNIVYADEGDPADLYRTILKLDDLRRPVFEEIGGSMLVLSPLGNKAMALGALMAALERDLPVAYVESIEYKLRPVEIGTPDLIHVWLGGEVYP